MRDLASAPRGTLQHRRRPRAAHSTRCRV